MRVKQRVKIAERRAISPLAPARQAPLCQFDLEVFRSYLKIRWSLS